MINAQLTTGYESSSGFRDAFTKIIGAVPTRSQHVVLKAAWIDTKLGPMVAIANEHDLFLLEFVDRCTLETQVRRLRINLNAAIIPGETNIIKQIESELTDYFAGKNIIFKTPMNLVGSPFQKNVWDKLIKIPAGETRSYLEIAKSLNAPTACRAVARANASNRLAIIIPCHRVINTNGEIGGYAGGVARKQWLLEHEKSFATKPSMVEITLASSD